MGEGRNYATASNYQQAYLSKGGGRCMLQPVRHTLGADTWKLYNECVTALSSFSDEICIDSRVRRHRTCPAGGSSRLALVLLGSCGTWTSRALTPRRRGGQHSRVQTLLQCTAARREARASSSVVAAACSRCRLPPRTR